MTPTRIALAAAMAGSCLLLATPAGAASFNCAAAHQPDERAICANRSLNDKDVTLSVLYNLVRRLVPMGSRGAIMDDQVAWLRGRHACGANAVCLSRAYDKRIAQIQRIIDDRVVSNGPF